MDFVPGSSNEDGFIFSDSLVLSPFISYQNEDVYNAIANTNGGSSKKRSTICDTYGASEANKKDDDRESKKVRHRDIEKQRRQEFSSLFKSLRSLLPFQYIQGKRSTTDQIFQAVNYIKDLEHKIKELKEKRNRIKRSITAGISAEECASSLSSTSTLSSSCSCVGDKHITVVVMPCLVGVEIIISCCVGRNKSCLSSVLHMLAQEHRLNVVSCVSTRLQERFIHTIVSQVDDGIKINVSELTEKLVNCSQSQEDNWRNSH